MHINHGFFFGLTAAKDAQKYQLVSELLLDAKSCPTFKGTVTLAADLKIIPVIA